MSWVLEVSLKIKKKTFKVSWVLEVSLKIKKTFKVSRVLEVSLKIKKKNFQSIVSVRSVLEN
jgi:hypothetical protein